MLGLSLRLIEQPAICIDTREQLPFEFAGLPTIRKKLDTGDYSLIGIEDKCVVERKSKVDAWSVVGQGRKRFVACLERLAVMDRPAIVIECSLAQFAVPPARTRLDARMGVGSYISWSCQYRIPVFWCGSREFAERVTIRWLMAYMKHMRK